MNDVVYLESVQMRITILNGQVQRSKEAGQKYEINILFEKLLKRSNADNTTTIAGKCALLLPLHFRKRIINMYM